MTDVPEAVAPRRKSKAQPKSDGSRKRIVASTLAMILERGAENISMSEICEAAQISRATLYRHFSSREAILESVYELIIDRLSEDVRTAITVKPDLDVRVDTVFDRLGAELASSLSQRLIAADLNFMFELLRRLARQPLPLFQESIAPVYDRADAMLGASLDRALIDEVMERLFTSISLFPSARSQADPALMLKTVFRALMLGLPRNIAADAPVDTPAPEAS